jgi:hypothetical protein
MLASLGPPWEARLDQLPPVPRQIPEPGVHAAVARHGLLRELHPAGAHPVVGAAALVDDQHERRHAAQDGASGEFSPQLTAFFTSALILASSMAVNSFSAKEVGHMAPSSRFAVSLKPNVAYLELNFCALWKKQMTLPSLA